MEGLRKVELKDKDIFNKFFKMVKEPLADTTFAMRYIWAAPMRHLWAIINGNLCVFGFLKDKYLLWGPPVGGDKLPETVSSCFEIVEQLNHNERIKVKPSAIYIPECLKSDYAAVAEKLGCTLEYWTQDYVYKTADLVGMKGKQFDSKRHKANFFAKNYDFCIEEFDFEKHSDGCLPLIQLWKAQKDEVISDSTRYELNAEAEVAATLIKNAQQLGVRGIVLKVEGKIAGVSLGEHLTQNMCSNIIEKTNPALNGASEFIFREFARSWPGCEFLNAQDDFGVDYLKRIKLSYCPAKLLASYCLEKK